VLEEKRIEAKGIEAKKIGTKKVETKGIGTKRIEAKRITKDAQVWEKAGVFYVRTEGMVKGFGVPIEGEFSGDEPDSEYVLLYEDNLPVATCRIHALDDVRAKIERVCVLSHLRGKGIGRALISEAEKWLAERGFKESVIASREAVVGFYEALNYAPHWDETEEDAFFRSIYTYKKL